MLKVYKNYIELNYDLDFLVASFTVIYRNKQSLSLFHDKKKTAPLK